MYGYWVASVYILSFVLLILLLLNQYINPSILSKNINIFSEHSMMLKGICKSNSQGKDSHVKVNESVTGSGSLKYPFNFILLFKISIIAYMTLRSSHIQWISNNAWVVSLLTHRWLKESCFRTNKNLALIKQINLHVKGGLIVTVPLISRFNGIIHFNIMVRRSSLGINSFYSTITKSLYESKQFNFKFSQSVKINNLSKIISDPIFL